MYRTAHTTAFDLPVVEQLRRGKPNQSMGPLRWFNANTHTHARTHACTHTHTRPPTAPDPTHHLEMCHTTNFHWPTL